MDRDGYIDITVADDAMTARGSFFPPLGEGRFLTPEYLESQLDGQGIVYGVKTGELAEVIFEVNTTHRARESVIIAEGTAPVSARPAFYRVLHAARTAEASYDTRSDRIDHKQVTRLPVVQKGQTIAILVPAIEGVPGTNIRDEEVSFPTLPVDTLQPGKNTQVLEDRIVAAVGGQLQTRDGEILVENRLEITGDVGYETGSIEFPGDISLKGEVRDGFHIWAGGSITAGGTVDVSEIYCRKDFTTAGGIVGRGRALLRCGGRIQGRFVGNCHVESKSSVFIKQYAYQAHIACLDRFAMGNRGRVIGGSLTVLEGVRCYTLGNPAHVATTIRVGINFIAERKLKHSYEKQQAVISKLKKLTAALPEDPSDRQLDILHKLENTRNTLMMEMGDLAGALDGFEQAEVIVDGEVYPGTRIQICRATFMVEETMKKVRFSLDKTAGRVTVQPFSDKPESTLPRKSR